MQSPLILVTGARGFVGRYLCRYLVERGYRVRGTVRANPPKSAPGIEYVASGNIDGETDWRPFLIDAAVVVHTAARVHIHGEHADALEPYRRVNVAASENLARQAAEVGVQRLVFLSTIKAREAKPAGGAYEISKLEAEGSLTRIAADTGLELVILRPPLVYGPGAGANFALLSRAVAKGWPLPLGSIRNRRSFIYLGNLCSAIAACLEHPKAPGGLFEVSDGAPLSTPDFVRAIGRALDRPARLWPCPPGVLRSLGSALGRSAAADSLTGDLVTNGKAIRERLDWHAPTPVADALKATFAAGSLSAP